MATAERMTAPLEQSVEKEVSTGTSRTAASRSAGSSSQCRRKFSISQNQPQARSISALVSACASKAARNDIRSSAVSNPLTSRAIASHTGCRLLIM